MENFKCVREDMEAVKLALEQIQATLDSTYQNATALQEMMSNVDYWDGEAHQVGMAFMDLTTQYHGMLAGTENRPVEQAVTALASFLDAESEFYDNWERYQELLGI